MRVIQGLEIMDALLVPAGLLVLIVYHCMLAYRVRTFPASTVVGINQINRQLWLRTMMQDGLKNGILAVQTLRNNIMASTLLASVAIALCSVIALLASGGKDGGKLTHTNLPLSGSRRPLIPPYAKLLCLFICFFVSCLCNIQSVRYYNTVSFLVTMPVRPCLSRDYVDKSMLNGGFFWSMGLRAFYFSFPLFFWLFGPIPMFLCSLVLTVLLHFLDTSNEFKHALADSPHADSMP